MSFSKTALFIPAASLLLLAAGASGACSNNNSVSTPPTSTPPQGVTFTGGTFGGSCQGDIYISTTGTGWAFCDGGMWAYTTTDPSSDGYMEAASDGGPSGNDTGPVDGSQGNDGKQENDGDQGHGEDGGQGQGGGQGGDQR